MSFQVSGQSNPVESGSQSSMSTEASVQENRCFRERSALNEDLYNKIERVQSLIPEWVAQMEELSKPQMDQLDDVIRLSADPKASDRLKDRVVDVVLELLKQKNDRHLLHAIKKYALTYSGKFYENLAEANPQANRTAFHYACQGGGS